METCVVREEVDHLDAKASVVALGYRDRDLVVKAGKRSTLLVDDYSQGGMVLHSDRFD